MRTILFFFVFSAAMACGETSPKNAPAAQQISESNDQSSENAAGILKDEEVKAVPIAQKAEEARAEPPKINTPKKTASPQAAKKGKPASKETSATNSISPTPPTAKEAPVAPTPDIPKAATSTSETKPTPVNPKPEPTAVLQPPSHETWNKLLGQYVSNEGKVNYKGLKNDKAKLEAYLETLQNNPPQDGWKRNEKMAFWINAYNAFTVKLIVDNYPVASITKLDGGKPWDRKWIKIGDKTYSLNNIENDILRPQFKDARIHFAVNCAAQSCPPLLNKAWTADNLESNFEKQAKAFVNNPKFNTISAKNVKVSKIFDWYKADFGNLIDFLNKYASTNINGNAKVEYVEYDWALNE